MYDGWAMITRPLHRDHQWSILLYVRKCCDRKNSIQICWRIYTLSSTQNKKKRFLKSCLSLCTYLRHSGVRTARKISINILYLSILVRCLRNMNILAPNTVYWASECAPWKKSWLFRKGLRRIWLKFSASWRPEPYIKLHRWYLHENNGPSSSCPNSC